MLSHLVVEKDFDFDAGVDGVHDQERLTVTSFVLDRERLADPWPMATENGSG